MNNVFSDAARFLEMLDNKSLGSISEKVCIYKAKMKVIHQEYSHDMRILMNELSELQKNPRNLEDVIARFKYYGAHSD